MGSSKPRPGDTTIVDGLSDVTGMTCSEWLMLVYGATVGVSKVDPGGILAASPTRMNNNICRACH